jgi:hypothetical protein
MFKVAQNRCSIESRVTFPNYLKEMQIKAIVAASNGDMLCISQPIYSKSCIIQMVTCYVFHSPFIVNHVLFK